MESSLKGLLIILAAPEERCHHGVACSDLGGPFL